MILVSVAWVVTAPGYIGTLGHSSFPVRTHIGILLDIEYMFFYIIPVLSFNCGGTTAEIGSNMIRRRLIECTSPYHQHI
jgi:hypothetical protein